MARPLAEGTTPWRERCADGRDASRSDPGARQAARVILVLLCAETRALARLAASGPFRMSSCHRATRRAKRRPLSLQYSEESVNRTPWPTRCTIPPARQPEDALFPPRPGRYCWPSRQDSASCSTLSVARLLGQVQPEKARHCMLHLQQCCCLGQPRPEHDRTLVAAARWRAHAQEIKCQPTNPIPPAGQHDNLSGTYSYT